MSMAQTSMEQMHMGTNNGVRTRERGREERTTCIHEVSPPCHAHLLMTHVNRATARAVSGNNYTIIPTPVAPLQLYQQSQHHLQSHWPQCPTFKLATPIKPSTFHPTPEWQCHRVPTPTLMTTTETKATMTMRRTGKRTGCLHSPPPSYPLSHTRHMQQQRCCTPR